MNLSADYKSNQHIRKVNISLQATWTYNVKVQNTNSIMIANTGEFYIEFDGKDFKMPGRGFSWYMLITFLV